MAVLITAQSGKILKECHTYGFDIAYSNVCLESIADSTFFPKGQKYFMGALLAPFI